MTDDVRHAPLSQRFAALMHAYQGNNAGLNDLGHFVRLHSEEIFQALRSETGTHSTRVEVMGHPDQPVSARCILSGCQDFSAASPDRDDLVNRLWGYEEYCREREMLDMARAFSEAALALERTDERSDK